MTDSVHTTITPAITRRAALAASLSAVPLLAVPAVAQAANALPSASDVDEQAQALWAERDALLAASDRAWKAYCEAADRLPWWAAPGPSRLQADGSMTGPVVGWPAVQDMTPPDHWPVFRIVRPSPSDIKESWRFAANWERGNSLRRAKERANYRKRMRELVARLRAQRVEEEALDLPGLDRCHDDLRERISQIDRTIVDMPGSATTPALLIMKILLALGTTERERRERDHEDEGVAVLLSVVRALRPSVASVVREHADRLLVAADEATA